MSKYCVKITTENYSELYKWWKQQTLIGNYTFKGWLLNVEGDGSYLNYYRGNGNAPQGYKELTLEQFKQLVLNKQKGYELW